jgi:hypothetical protein
VVSGSDRYRNEAVFGCNGCIVEALDRAILELGTALLF